MKIRAYDIDWDTDGEEVDLPTEAIVELTDEEVIEEMNGNNVIADKLSDEYCWLIFSLKIEDVPEDDAGTDIVKTAQFYLDRKDYSPGSDFENICRAVISLDAASKNNLAMAQKLYDCLNDLRQRDEVQGVFEEDEAFNNEVEDALQMFETARAKDIEAANP